MKTKNIVTIGGGTGNFTLLNGLKKYPVNISAIVSMVDDGGSTGVLRDELGVLPPGDVRQCLVALSESSDELRDLMNYRFEEGGLKGHNFGNLFLSALEKTNESFSKAVKKASKILKVNGEVIPVTDEDTNLFIELKDGKVLSGENEINRSFEIEKVGIKKIYLSPKAAVNREAIERIMEADLVIIGPGNYYCSLVPNFLVKGIAEAIRKTKAKIVFNCNLVNKKGHTEKFSVDDYVDSMNGYIGEKRIDFVTFNTEKPNRSLIKKYESQRELMVKLKKNGRKRNYKIIRADILSNQKPSYSRADTLSSLRSFIRHDEDELARILMMILEIGNYKNIIKEII